MFNTRTYRNSKMCSWPVNKSLALNSVVGPEISSGEDKIILKNYSITDLVINAINDLFLIYERENIQIRSKQVYLF